MDIKKFGGLGLAIAVILFMDILDLTGTARVIGWLVCGIGGGVVAYMWDRSNNKKK
ncbi:MAG: hypothetical protein RRY12_08790 [Cloacibacillus sp.]